jgi:hypothetical protein
MLTSRPRITSFIALLGIALAAFVAIGISSVQAQEGTPTPEPEEVPLVPTPMAPPEEPPLQALAQAEQASAPSDDRLISDEPDNSIRPVVAYSGAGDVYLAVWQDSLDFAATNIYARFVDAEGNALGTRFLVAGERPGRVQVKVAAGGGIFSVIWREGQDPGQASLYVQRVTGSFSESPLLSSPVLVHSAVENQFHAIFNPDRGEFLLIWLDPRNSVLASFLRGEVFGRRMTPAGVLDAGEVNFTPVPTNPSISQILNAPAYQTDLSAAYNPELAQYLLTYGTYNCTNISCTIREEVRGQRLDAGSLARLGNPVFITPNPSRIQWAARVLYDPRLDQYVAFWNDNRIAEIDFAIFAQRISSQGSLIGANQAIVSESGSQLWPEAAYLNVDAPLARYFLAWEDDPGTFPHFARGAFLLESLSRDGEILDLSAEMDSSQQVPQLASDHQVVPNILAVWQHTRPAHSADVHAQCLCTLAQNATVSVLDDDGVSILPWDGLADTSIFVEARLPAVVPSPPDSLNALITAHQSGKRTLVSLPYATTDGADYVYRSQPIDADQLVDRPDELTVAAVVNAQVEYEYEVAQRFMDRLGIPMERRRGIAWGTGDEATGRPPADLEFFTAAGYENAKVALLGYTDVDEFLLKNQADVFPVCWRRLSRHKCSLLGEHKTRQRPEHTGSAGSACQP